MFRSWIGLVLQGIILLVLIALIAGQLLGQPILLGFVETGSMEPTIDAGDGFVAVPSAVAGEPEPGDVVVFEAEEIEDGGLTTHRVVGETDEGYVTRGDANPFPDQEGDEPPVREEQIVAVAWQVDGEVVTIPALGTAVMAVGERLEQGQMWLGSLLGTRAVLGSAGLAVLLFAISGVAFVVETIRERRAEAGRETRSREDDAGDGPELGPRGLCLIFALVVVVAAAGAMVVPAGTQSYDVVSAEFESDRPLVIEQGTTTEVPYRVSNGAFVPVVSYVEPEGDHVDADGDPVTVGPRGEDERTLSITAPAETGHHPTHVVEYRYLYVLPVPVIDALYEIHPWVPLGTILALLGGTTYAIGRLLLGSPDGHSHWERTRERRSRVGSLRRWL